MNKASAKYGHQAIGIIVAACLLCLAPFLNKAFHIDDYLFIAAANHIQNHPVDFYGFIVNWYGRDMAMFDVMKNPPLASYYIAAVSYFFGWQETTLHLAFVLPAVAVILGTFCLARQSCSHPLAAAFAALATPVFLISATNVMCDVMMLAFWVWAVYFWVEGLKSDRMGCLALSAFLIALSGLTKYFGIALIPLLIVYSIYLKKGIGRWLLVFLVPAAILAVYNSGTQILYGRGLLADAGAYASHVKGLSRAVFKEMMIGLSFTGGCLLPYLFFSPLLLSRIFWVCGFLLTAVAVFATHLYFGGAALMTAPAAILLAHMVVFIMTAACILSATTTDAIKTRNPEAVLFFLWILGTFVFAVFVNWTINGRSLLPMAPAAAIVLVRRLEARGFLAQGWKKPWPWVLPLIPALVIGLLAAHADRSLADANRNAAAVIRLATKQSTGALWFGGHWGFQYYMESLGGRPIKAQFRDFKTGDLAVMPVNNTNLFKMPPTIVRLRNSYALQPFEFLTTMNPRLGAGFYAHIWGPLPFAFGNVPPERYDLYEIVMP